MMLIQFCSAKDHATGPNHKFEILKKYQAHVLKARTFFSYIHQIYEDIN